MRIAVLGLGRMGAPMARNLAEIGHQVTLFNRTHARALELGTAVGKVASSVAAAVAETQVALTMVSDDAAELALTFDTDGLLAHLPPGAIHLCMSTIGVETSRRLAAAHEAKGQGYVAAPVFGRPGGASTRHLWILAGGPEAQVTRCLGIFDALGRGLTRVGTAPELAHAVKLGGNLLTTFMVEGLAEVLAFGEKAGMPPAEFLRLMNTAIFKSPVLDSYGGLMVRRAFEPADLTLAQALADTRAALRAFDASEIPVPLAELLCQRLEGAEAMGFGAQDLSALFQACRTEVETGKMAPRRGDPASRPAPPQKERRKKKRPTPGAVNPPGPSPTAMAAPAVVPMTRVREVPSAPEPIPAPVRSTANPEKLPLSVPVSAAPLQPRIVPDPGELAPGISEAPRTVFHAREGERMVTLELNRTTHFELAGGVVWAWNQGHRFKTSWQNLAEVEQAFRHVLFLRIQPEVLLQPETVLDLRSVFGGRAKAKVAGNLELDVSRSAVPRLKELLGM